MSSDSAARTLDVRLRARLRDWGAPACSDRAGRPQESTSPPTTTSNCRRTLPSSRAWRTPCDGRASAAPARACCAASDSFVQVERRFASLKQTEASLYFSSGYLTNIAVLTTLPEAGDVIFSDARNHASLIDGTRLSRAEAVVFPHNDVGALARAMRSREAALRFVVVESLFSMDGDMAPLADYAEVCQAWGALLIVDEAHAVGIYGQRGSGLIEATGIQSMVTASINTAGKALGVAGAFVASSVPTIQYLTQRARPFVFSTAPPPALADAVEANFDLVEAEPERRLRLHQRSAHLRARLAGYGIDVLPGSSQILSVMVSDNERAVRIAAALQADVFDVRAIRPPSVPDGTARLRLSVNAGLTELTLDQFAALLVITLREAGVTCAVSS